jgi:Putative MetA-pathway of phenol degradation
VYCVATRRPKLTAALTLLIVSVEFARADPQLITQPAAAAIDADKDPEYDGLDITRPQNRFEVRLPYRASGASGGTTQESALLRLDQRYDLSKMWTLGILTELPFVARQTSLPNNSSVKGDFGLGDAFIEPTLVRKLSPQWSMAFGTRVVGPSADNSLGGGKWQVLPIVAARYEWAADSYVSPLVRYAVSFAGDPSRRGVSTLELQPLVNVGLPKNWFVVLFPSPDIRINYGPPIAGQTGQLFFPADILVGVKFNKNLVIGLEVSEPIIKEYPVYNFKTELRLQLTF